ncbi:MAG: hypothetical protein CMQ05_18610 [Gammaproteobacteria bacterium]|uniref:Uncharacterized protein n=1 Tax=OM182 bacterium MED-G24 TaxID=1986255 RepID=A0A2A5WU24_9GAMM|nr:hypothetical protein [Gammaproteobacteria bacterium]PDH39921.1 MAG: hypothetical protein CNE99_04520 [OM182 bacterium MED-G24]RPG23751.1 MAG: hypothetical protein CBC10_013855 [Gammaproteobacteria bacterium TMED50]
MEGQNLVAWIVYLVSGLVFTWAIVVLSRRFRAWFRDLFLGTAVVLIFTPWQFGDTAQHWAPAILVLLMDLLLEGTESGLQGGVVLLCMTTVMIGVVLVRMWLRRRKTIGNTQVSELSG